MINQAIFGDGQGLRQFTGLLERRRLSSFELSEIDRLSQHNPVTFCAAYEPLRAFSLGRDVDALVEICVWESVEPRLPERVEPATLAWDLEWDYEQFEPRLAQVVEYLKSGDCYQINLTLRGWANTPGSAEDLFWRLYARQPVPYAALMPFGEGALVSLSPELMWHQQGEHIRCEPMKGTLARGQTPEADDRGKAWLAGDLKNQAENLMILDLLRNDLGRIAKTGSVAVPERFKVKSFATVHQMVSSVTATLSDFSFAGKLAALAPYGSITGAPKVRAMEIIDELETSPRGLYTGLCGFQWGDTSMANVPIRSGYWQDGRFEFGLGGGMTVDSRPADEWQEIQAKAAFLGV